VNPKAWLERLQLLEAEVVMNSAISEFQQPLAHPNIDDIQGGISHDFEVIMGVLKNIRLMNEVNYCGEAINALFVDSKRPHVAYLQSIAEADIEKLSFVYQYYLDTLGTREAFKLLEHCFAFLDVYSLTWPSLRDVVQVFHATSQDILHYSLLYASRAVSRFLDLAAISYCGAHLESIDEKYLDITLDQFSIPCDTTRMSITMKRRSLLCLGGYLRDEPVWVFQTVEEAPLRSEEALYVSTTLDDFADVFGPVWQTNESKSSSTVLKYNVGKGFIIPWTRFGRDPIPLEGEVFCHWTEDVDDLEGAENFPRSYDRLLIGASTYLTRNPRCSTTTSTFTREMRMKKRCRVFGTSYPSKYRDSQTAQVGISGYGLAANYSEQFKIHKGVTLKDNVVGAWTSNEGERDINLIKNYYGVEISACTDNARRRTLFQILQSTTMRRYLKGNSEIRRSELDRYFTALDGAEVDIFISRYKKHRKAFAKILSKCFGVLKGTGTDSKHCLTAFWYPEQGNTYAVEYPNSNHRWTGLLADSPDTCTFAIVTDLCLELSDGNPACQDRYEASSCPGVLETSVIINPAALPVTASGRRRNRTLVLPDGYRFDLHKAGSLKMIKTLGSGLVVDWSRTRLPAMRPLKSLLRNGKFISGTGTCHDELILWDDRKERKVVVLVVGERKMQVSIGSERRR
jgi:hypothetical protein